MAWSVGEEKLDEMQKEIVQLLRSVSDRMCESVRIPEEGELDSAQIRELFRGVHNLKAYAGYLGLDSIVRLCDACENIFEQLQMHDTQERGPVSAWIEETANQLSRWSGEIAERGILCAPDPAIFSPPLQRTGESESNPRALLKELTLLYVEDDADIRSGLERTMRRWVKNVWTALDGAEGVELFERHRPDLVVADINMPRLHGFEMAQRIRQEAPNIPIVFTTAHNEPPFVARSEQMGINGYLIKPFSFQSLERELQKIAVMTYGSEG